MKHRHALLLAIFLCAAFAARALTPEERYIQAYTIMREGDGLVVANQGRAALLKYREALDRIRALQRSDPAWNPSVVSYRLDYLDSRVKKLAAQFPGAEAPPATTRSAPTQAEAQATFVPPAGPPAVVIKSLQEETVRLNKENATLQAKLKEALSVQPAAADPRELVKAQEQINILLKERDLLRVSAEQLKDNSRVATAARPADQQALAEVQKQVAQQAAVAASLREQNDNLQRQLAEARKTVAPGTEPQMTARLQSAQDEIAGLVARNQAMQSELATLKSAPTAPAPAPATAASGKEIEKLEKQLNKANATLRSAEEDRDEIKAKYAEAQKELKGKLPPDTAAKLEEQGRQLTVMRARLDAYEAKPVPFTAEELALVKQPATPRMAAASVTDTNLMKRKTDLPRGAAPLFNEAQRAIDAKRFSDAEEKLKQVLSQDENNIYVLATLSGVQLDLNKPADAENNLKKALATDPRDAASLYLMGSLKLSQEKYDEALDSLSQAVQITPDNPMAQFNLGRALSFKGNLKAAETAFRKAITLKPNWGDAHYQLAVIYLTGNPPFIELAKWHYQKSITGGMPRNFEFEKRLDKGNSKP